MTDKKGHYSSINRFKCLEASATNKVIGEDASLDGLVDDFKGVCSSLYVNQVKTLIRLNSIVTCKTKSHTPKKQWLVGFLRCILLYTYSPKLSSSYM